VTVVNCNPPGQAPRAKTLGPIASVVPLGACAEMFGGSTGTVVSGADEWLRRNGGHELTAVAISPDLGERYLDTIYDDGWVEDHYGVDVLACDEPVADAPGPGRPDRSQPARTADGHTGRIRSRRTGQRRPVGRA
jgi:hypothetical protein